jgi:RNA polymerase sigma factor (sigma-70 family)
MHSSKQVKMQEHQLVEGCRNGNIVAQKQLFMQYKDAMFTTLYRITGNRQDAEDALQEGFIKVFGALNTYRNESSLGAWMKTIFVRTGLERMRKQIHFMDIEAADNKPVHFDDTLSGEMLEKAILQLDEGYRTVLLLVEVEGYKHREVAEMLGISEGTSKSQLARAKTKLKNMLGKNTEYNA